MKNKLLIILTSLILLIVPSLEAKWWIFGGSENESGFEYLYAGNLSFDDVNDKVVILKESLDKGYLHIKGKAQSGSSQIGAIKVSLDGAKTWKKAKFEKDGGFDFSFEPNIKESYDIYVKVIDTSGKSNDIQDSHIVVSFSDFDVQETIQATLDQLKNSYENENESHFMKYVSQDFEGDDITLERALRKDFASLEDIRLEFSISSIAFSDSKYYASIFFNRHVTASGDGSSHADNGVTEFTFSVGDKGAMLLSMKNPLIFGLSYASDVATGTVASVQNSDEFITISDDGTVEKKNLSDIASGDDDYSTSGTFTLVLSCSPPCNNADGFNFTNDGKTTLISSSEVYKEGALLFPNAGSQLLDLGVTNIDGITVPDSGYGDPVIGSIALDMGRAIAVNLTDNTYAVLEVIVFTDLGGGVFEVTFKYKYNPGGSRSF